MFPRPDGLREDQMMNVREYLSSKARVISFQGVMQNDMDINVLLAFDAISSDPIKLVISSPGGYLDIALMMYDTIKLCKSPIYTLGRSCASAAVLILASGTKRYLLPNAKVMIHSPHAELAGKVEDLVIQMAAVSKVKDIMVDLLIENGVKKSKEEVLQDMQHEYWMTAQEAIDYGLADEIMTKEVMAEWLE